MTMLLSILAGVLAGLVLIAAAAFFVLRTGRPNHRDDGYWVNGSTAPSEYPGSTGGDHA